VNVRNTGTATLHGWTVKWTFVNGQTIGGLWGATYTQTGADVTAHSVAWTATVAPGGTATFGFTGRLPGTANTTPAPSCSPG
jgi:cellulase/cellobiase CelA1